MPRRPIPTKDIEAFLKTLPSAHPDVYPSAVTLVSLLADASISISRSTLAKHFDLESLQIAWIGYSNDDIFLLTIADCRLTNPKPEFRAAIKAKVVTIIKKTLDENPSVFPTKSFISAHFESRRIPLSESTIGTCMDLPLLQRKWVESSKEADFAKIATSSALSKLDAHTVAAARKRLVEISQREIDAVPDIFPTAVKLQELLSKKGINVGNRAAPKLLDIPKLQAEWIQSQTDEKILNSMSSSENAFASVGDDVKAVLRTRFKSIVKKAKPEPDIFPTPKSICDGLENHYKIKLAAATITSNLDITPFQLSWIENGPEEAFLSAISNFLFSSVDDEVKEAKKKRFTGIVERVLSENPDVVPTDKNISILLNGLTGAAAIKNNVNLIPLQLKWITSSDEDVFLEHFTKNTLAGMTDVCREAVSARIRSIMIAHAKNIHASPLTNSTIRNYALNYPELTFLIVAFSGTRSLDQSIVARLSPWRETRSDELHQAVYERLTQLWGFRELFALLKDGRCIEADIISPFHESLHQQMSGFIPEASLCHFFVDQLMDGSYVTGFDKDVLLLSFFSWLTEKQAAEALVLLNQGVESGNSIIMTFPSHLDCTADLSEHLASFGFKAESVGTLYLHPPVNEEVEEGSAKKIETVSNILTFRKFLDIEDTPDSIRFFTKTNGSGDGVVPGPSKPITSYRDEVLEGSIPTISLRDFHSVVVDDPPIVKGIMLDDSSGILELKGGSLVGFNADPAHPHSVEIEGHRIPKGLNMAILDVITGTANLLEVPDKMKADYDEFVKIVRKKRKEISGIRTTRIKIRRKQK